MQLELLEPGSDASTNVWSALCSPSEHEIDMSMSRADYLAAIVPGRWRRTLVCGSAKSLTDA